MIELHDTESGESIGSITDAQLQFISEALEEESIADRDYYITPDTVDLLEEEGADEELVALLRDALAGRDGMEVSWSRA